MDKCLKPDRFETDPTSPDSKRKWQHWIRTFTGYINSIEGVSEKNKLNILINHVDTSVYEYISEAETYEAAITILHKIYIKPINEIFARYRLTTCKQQPDQTLDEYIQILKRLSKDCNFTAVNPEQHRQEGIRDAFMAGLMSNHIRQRLLESENINLQYILDKARSLDAAQKNSEEFSIAQAGFKPDDKQL